MNEWEKFIQSFYARIAAFLDRISTMTETHVLAMLRGISASRNSQNQTLAFLNSVALNALEDTDDEINKLRSQLSSRARSEESGGLDPLDYIEEALKKRLVRLRSKGK